MSCIITRLPCFNRRPPAQWYALLLLTLPVDTFAGNGHPHEALGIDSVIIGILTGVIIILTAVLLLYKQMRRELARINTALRKSRKHIRLIGDKLPAITIFQLAESSPGEWSFRELSKGIETSLNIDPAPLLANARAALDHIYEEDIELLRQFRSRTPEQLEPVDLELRILDRSGNLRWLRVNAVPHRERRGMVWDGFLQDISDGKNMESTLIEEKHNFEQLFETIDDFLIVCDLNGRLLHTNSTAQKKLSYSADKLADMSLFELYAEEHRQEMFETAALMQTQLTARSNLPLQTSTGQSVQVEMSIFQGRWQEEAALFCVARDMQRRRQTETALRESQQMLQLILDTIPIAVFWSDENSVYLGCNKTFVKACGLEDASDVIGKTPMEVYDKETASQALLGDQQVISTNRPLINEMQSHPRPDGSMGWREISKIPLRDEQDAAVGVLGVWRDITNQYHAEERLKRTLEDMERFNQLMRGRERRTLQLKAEVNDLLSQLEEQPKYRTTKDSLP